MCVGAVCGSCGIRCDGPHMTTLDPDAVTLCRERASRRRSWRGERVGSAARVPPPVEASERRDAATERRRACARNALDGSPGPPVRASSRLGRGASGLHSPDGSHRAGCGRDLDSRRALRPLAAPRRLAPGRPHRLHLLVRDGHRAGHLLVHRGRSRLLDLELPGRHRRLVGGRPAGARQHQARGALDDDPLLSRDRHRGRQRHRPERQRKGRH